MEQQLLETASISTLLEGTSLSKKKAHSPPGIRGAPRFKPGAQLVSFFCEKWAKGEPFVVEGAMEAVNPQQFMDMDDARQLEVTVQFGETGDQEVMSWAQYFERWTTAKANKQILKVKVRIPIHPPVSGII